MRYHVQAIESGNLFWHTAMIRVPVTPNATSGVLSFNTPIDPSSFGYYTVDNVYIPKSGTCLATNASLPPFVCSEDQGIYLEEMYTTAEEYEGFFSGSKLWTVDYATETISPLGVISIEPGGADFKNLNSIGFNAIDNYFWAHRVGTDQLVRIGNNMSADLIRVPGLPTSYYTAGEVSNTGVFYLAYARNSGLGYNRIDRIDLTTATPTLMSPIICDRNLKLLDLAFNPIDGSLYGLEDIVIAGVPSTELIKINASNGQVTTVAIYPNSTIYGAVLFHTAFFDMHGNLYASTSDGNNNRITIRFEEVHAGGTPSFGYYGSAIFSNDGTSCRNEFPEFMISGNVWHDLDLDNQMDGSENKTNLGTTYENGLWVNLVNSNNEVIGHAPVNLDGTYTLYTSDNNSGSHKLILTQTKINLGQTLTTSSINSEWTYSGVDNQGVGTNNTTGILDLTLSGNASLDNINFGIQKRPETDDHETIIANPGISTLVIGTGSFPQLSGTDTEDGDYTTITGTILNPTYITINSLPANGQLLFQNIPVLIGQIITTYQAGDLSISVNGNLYEQTSFTYSYTDAKGAADATPNTYTINWSDPLSTKLLDLNAKEKEGIVILSWKTGSEQNNKGFNIEVSSNGKDWKTIGFEASRHFEGTCNTQMNYEWKDFSPMAQKIYYRLKQIDHDNQYSYTKTLTITIGQNNLIKAYPNPTSNQLTVNGIETGTLISIVDIQGKTVKKQKATDSNITLDVHSLSPGAYQLHIQSLDGKTSSYEFIKY